MEDFDSLSIEENHALGIAHFNAGEYFAAHEAWETCWKQQRGAADAEFFKGLAQLGAGYVHLLRGNAHGARTLLARASGRIGRYPVGHLGIDTSAVEARCTSDGKALLDGDLVPGPGALEGTFLHLGGAGGVN